MVSTNILCLTKGQSRVRTLSIQLHLLGSVNMRLTCVNSNLVDPYRAPCGKYFF